MYLKISKASHWNASSYNSVLPWHNRPVFSVPYILRVKMFIKNYAARKKLSNMKKIYNTMSFEEKKLLIVKYDVICN